MGQVCQEDLKKQLEATNLSLMKIEKAYQQLLGRKTLLEELITKQDEGKKEEKVSEEKK